MKRRLRPWVKVTLGVLWLSALTKAASCSTALNNPVSAEAAVPDTTMNEAIDEAEWKPLLIEEAVLCTPKIIKEVKLL